MYNAENSVAEITVIGLDLYGEHRPEERIIGSKTDLDLSAGSSYTRVYTVVRNGIIISDDHATAKAFNDYFIEFSTLDDSSANLLPNYKMLTQNKLEHLESRVGDVQKCLSQMDTTKTFRTDGCKVQQLNLTCPNWEFLIAISMY